MYKIQKDKFWQIHKETMKEKNINNIQYVKVVNNTVCSGNIKIFVSGRNFWELKNGVYDKNKNKVNKDIKFVEVMLGNISEIVKKNNKLDIKNMKDLSKKISEKDKNPLNRTLFYFYENIYKNDIDKIEEVFEYKDDLVLKTNFLTFLI